MGDDIDEQQQAVMQLLEPHFGDFTRVYEAAVQTYNDHTAPIARAEHDSRAALSAIYSHAWMGVKREFGELQGYHFLEVKGLHLLNIRDQVVLRTKRVNANGLHVNNQTDQQVKFDRQMPIPGLPAEAVRVVVGYELDPAFSRVERVIVRCPSSRWAAQVVAADESFAWEDITPARLPFRMGRRAQG